MKKNNFLRILIVVSLVLLAMTVALQASKAEAKGGVTCSVYPANGQVFKRADCDSFQFVSGWIAINEGLISDFQKGALVTVSVTGKDYSQTFSPEVVNSLWADDAWSITPEEAGLKCTVPYLWGKDYYLPLGSLEPGTYQTVLTVEPEHPLKDGIADNCTWLDGSPITEFPSLYTTTDTYINTFKVK